MLSWHSTLVLLFHLALLDGIVAEDGASTGTDGWGMTVYVSKNPRECAPFHVYFNINHDGTPPGTVILPDAAALSFLMPDSSAAEWMVLRPPMGTGMLSWTCALPAGTQFAILNGNGFKQMFTVGPSESASRSCWQNASSITSSSKYGSLDVSVYRLLLSASYTPISIGDSFNPVEMPSTVGLDFIRVSLGATGPNDNKKPSSSSAATPTKTTTGVTPSATRLPQAPDGPTAAPTPSLGSQLQSISRSTHSKEPGDASIPAPLPSASETHSSESPKGGSTKRGFIIGAVLAALAPSAILGAFLVIVLKRRISHGRHGALPFSLTRGGPAESEAARSLTGRPRAMTEEPRTTALSRAAGEEAEEQIHNTNGKRAADHDEVPAEMRTGDARRRRSDPRTRTAVSEDLPSYRSSVEL